MSDASLPDREFRLALEALADTVVATDASNLVLWANPALEQLLGWKPEELRGQPLVVLMPERMRAAHLAGFARYQRTHQPKVMGRPMRVPALHKDGHEVPIDLTLAAARIGDRELIIASLRDVTDRIELERQLTSQRLIEAHFTAMSLLARARTSEGVFPDLLRAMCDGLGYDVALIWRRQGDVLLPEDCWSCSDRFDPFLEGCQGLRLAEGEGLPGSVWKERRPLWHADVVGTDGFVRSPLAETSGLHGGLAFPILGRESLLGVLEFLKEKQEPPDEDLVRTVTTLGLQLGQFLERLETEEELRRSEEWFSTTLRSLGDAVIATNVDGTVRFMNPAAESLTGYPEREAVGRPLDQIFRIFNEETGRVAESPIRKVLREGQVVGLANHTVLLTKGGDRLVIEDAGAPILSERGRVDGVVLVFRDATARRAAALEREWRLERERAAREEAEARQARAELLARAGEVLATSLDYNHTLTSLAGLAVPHYADWCMVHLLEGEAQLARQVAVAHVDPDKVKWAREFEKRFPPDPHAARGAMAVIRTGRAELYKQISEQLLLETATDPELQRILRELNMRSAMVVPLSARGRTFGAITFITSESQRRYDEEDLVTARQLADRAALAIDNARLYLEAQEAIRARDDFLSIASHELRTPLTPLQLQIQALRRSGRKLREDPASVPDLEERLRSVHRQGQRLARLVNELLDISRISAGKFSLNLEPLELGRAVQGVVSQLEELGELQRAKTSVALDLEPGLVGEWDPLRIEQIVFNLVSNALKYGGEVPIEVRARRHGAFAWLQVSDHGIGIAPEDQRRIFDRFERAVSARHYGGLGLGLFIVRQVVEAMGGTIELASVPGAGSTFTVKLPLQRAPAAAESSAPHAS